MDSIFGIQGCHGTKDELRAVVAGAELEASELPTTGKQEAQVVLPTEVRGQKHLAGLSKNTIPDIQHEK